MEFHKYNVKEKKKKKQGHKNDKKYIHEVCFFFFMKFALKKIVFFWKVLVGYKNEN